MNPTQTATDEIDLYHKKWFEDACEIAKRVGASVIEIIHLLLMLVLTTREIYRSPF